MPFAGISFFIFKYPKILYNKYILIHQKKQKNKKPLGTVYIQGVLLFPESESESKN